MTQIKKIRNEHLQEAGRQAEQRVIKPYLLAKQTLGIGSEMSTIGLEKYRKYTQEEIKTILAIQIGMEEAKKGVIGEEPEDINERIKRYDQTLKDLTDVKIKLENGELESFSLFAGSGVAYLFLSKEMDNLNRNLILRFEEKLGKLTISLPNNLSDYLMKENQYIRKIIDFLEENNLVRTEQEYDCALLFSKFKISKQRYELWREKEFKRYGKLILQINSFTINCLDIEDTKTGIRVGEKKITQEDNIEDVEWEDVIGQEEAKKMLRDNVVRFLATYDSSTKKSIFENVLGTRPPKAILLFGPPGSGKTFSIKAAITEAAKIRDTLKEEGKGEKIHLNIISAADIKNKYVGESAKSIKRVFDNAKKEAPSLLVIDEIDALFSKRKDNGFNEGEREICSVMMQELDGIMKSEGYIVVGITNMPRSLDKAITSRFAVRIEYKHPKNEKEMADLLKVHLRNLIKIKALPEFTAKEWEKIGEIGIKHRFSGRMAKQFAEKLEMERNEKLTEIYKENMNVITTYYSKPDEIKEKLAKISKEMNCDRITQKMIDFGQAMHMSEEYSGV